MVTAFYSLLQVKGADLWMLFWLISAAAYLGIGLLIRYNCTVKGVKNMLIGLLISEVITDIMWAVIYCYNSVYLSYGIGAVYGLILWVPLLAVTLVVVTVKNRKAEKL